MTKKYFPGANTGRGFISHFSGIVPPWEKPHYTYIIKGGPGVGKNTLMKKVSCLARANGHTVEEFRCAGDPGSLDAVRIPEKRLVLLDGTAPHVIDPVIPGIEAEILDLGHFLHREVFLRRRSELQLLFDENKAHYREAYACLGAAAVLRSTAVEAAASVTDTDLIRRFLQEHFTLSSSGNTRRLFLTSPTPDGILDLHDSLEAENTVLLPGILGTVFLTETAKFAAGTKHTVFSDHLLPELPRSVYFPDSDTLLCCAPDMHSVLDDFLLAPLPEYVFFAETEIQKLCARAVESLRLCKRTHDAIEAIYRPYVDFDRVNRDSVQLLESLEL